MKKLILVFGLVLTMAIPALAADSTSLFNTQVLGTNIDQSASVTPVGTVITWASDKMPNDGPGVWLECDGRAIPIDAKYQDLRDYLMSNNTPNYTNQFLRGGTSAQVGQVAADSTRSHAHQMDQHSHTVSGTASKQSYKAPAAGGGGETYTRAPAASARYSYICHEIWGEGSMIIDTNTAPYNNRGYLIAQVCPVGYCAKTNMGSLYEHGNFLSENTLVGGGASATAYTSGGSITGITDQGGATSTHTAGGAETAPQHTRVRYLIRALP